MREPRHNKVAPGANENPVKFKMRKHTPNAPTTVTFNEMDPDPAPPPPPPDVVIVPGDPATDPK